MKTAQAQNFGSSTEGAYLLVRRDILSGRIAPGERLKVAELVNRFSVSQGAIREALARLMAEGLVESEPQRGFRAKGVSAEELRDLTTVRINVETECIRRSLKSADLDWEKRLVAVHHAMTRVTREDDSGRPSDEWNQTRLEFHETLSSGCSCGWLLQLRTTLHAQSARYYNIFHGPAGSIEIMMTSSRTRLPEMWRG